MSPCARWQVTTAIWEKLRSESVVITTSSLSPAGILAEVVRNDDGRPATKCLMKALAAKIFPFSRNLWFVSASVIRYTRRTYGITPRKANRPNVSVGAPHFKNASASNRALSRDPAESRYGSAISYAPSDILQFKNAKQRISCFPLTFLKQRPDIVVELWVACGMFSVFR